MKNKIGKETFYAIIYKVLSGVYRDDNILEKSGGTHSMVTFSCPGMV